MMKCIYLAYDESDFDILKSLVSDKWEITLLFDNTAVLSCLEKEPYDFVIFDIEAGGNFPPDVLQSIRLEFPSIPIFILTRCENETLRKDFIQYKISDFFEIPKDFLLIEDGVEKFFNCLSERKGNEDADFVSDRKVHYLKNKYIGLIGESLAMSKVKDFIDKATKIDLPVLLTGETGTGKNMCAKIIHENSNFQDGEFKLLNVSCIPDSLAESTLFGSEKGSFTGAEDKEGFFASADGGTLFLDELENLSLAIQAKLLTVIETKQIRPIGSTKTKKVNFRLICATNKNLKTLVQENKFREDLYYRLDVLHHTIPPLRERKEDIAMLIDYYMRDKEKTISTQAIRKLTSHDWPGNVRELFHCLDRACFNAFDESIIEAKHIEF